MNRFEILSSILLILALALMVTFDALLFYPSLAETGISLLMELGVAVFLLIWGAASVGRTFAAAGIAGMNSLFLWTTVMRDWDKLYGSGENWSAAPVVFGIWGWTVYPAAVIVIGLLFNFIRYLVKGASGEITL